MIDRAHGGNIWPYLKGKEDKIIDFSVNVNPFLLPKGAKKTLIGNLDKLMCYPDPESAGLKKAFAAFHGVEPENLVIGNGSIELIYLTLAALRPKKIFTVQPTFSEYEFAAKANNAAALFIKNSEADDFRMNMRQLKKNIPQANLFFLCNPNNPTGTLLSYEDTLSIWGMCRKHKVTLVIDEVFMDFVQKKKRFTFVNEAVKENNLLILKSLTKLFGIAGLRIGYLIWQKDTIKKIARIKYPWNVNLLAQAFGEEIIKQKSYINKTQSFICKEKGYLFDNLSRIKGMMIFPSEANFLLCKLENSRIKNSAELNRRLLRQGILIRDCSNFRGLNNRFFRVSIRKRGENNRLISAINGILR